MVLGFKAGYFTKNTTTTGYPFNQDTNGFGFQPKAAILFSTTTTSSLSDRWRSFISFTSGIAGGHRCIMFASEDNVTTPNNFRGATDAYAIRQTTSTAVEVLATASFIADGLRLTFDQNSASAYNIEYIAVGGDDITDVKVGSFTPNTTTGNQQITDVGFQPDIVFFMGTNTPVPTGTTSVDHNNWFFGVAKSAGEQVVVAGCAPEAAASNPSLASRVSRTDKCIMYYTQTPTTTTLDCHIAYVGATSAGSGGFTLDITDAPAATAQPIFYLAIKGGSWKVGSTTARTTTGQQSVISQGFTPKGLLLFGHGDTSAPTGATSSDFSTNASRMIFGSTDSPSSTTRWSIFSGDKAGVNPTVTIRGFVGNGVIWRSICEDATAASSVVTSSASLQSFDSADDGKFVIDWTATDGVERQLLYVTAGDAPPPSEPPPPPSGGGVDSFLNNVYQLKLKFFTSASG